MKKNRLSRFAILMLALAMASMMLVSGTYAKYTSQATGTATATVAKWSILLAGEEIAMATPQTVDIDLFSTILDSDLSTAEDDVDDDLIAPGTSGTFDLVIENDSEVNAEYTLLTSITNTSSVPLEFKVGDGAWSSDLTALNTASATGLDMNGDSDTITVSWRWVYENGTGNTLTANDAADTALGIAARTTAPTVTVSVTVVATQVD